jgi:two-component system chemotaxis response regulator CheB
MTGLNCRNSYEVVLIGASAGGGEALAIILSRLPAKFFLPIVIVQHLHASDGGSFAETLSHRSRLTIVVPCDKQKIEPGKVYVAPANYHMLIERTGYISLSVEEKVKWSRPSIDVLFESAAYAMDERVIAILLTGANNDGVEGMRTVRALGGITIAQDPKTAEHPVMPQAAIDKGAAEKILRLDEIAEVLGKIAENPIRK